MHDIKKTYNQLFYQLYSHEVCTFTESCWNFHDGQIPNSSRPSTLFSKTIQGLLQFSEIRTTFRGWRMQEPCYKGPYLPPRNLCFILCLIVCQQNVVDEFWGNVSEWCSVRLTGSNWIDFGDDPDHVTLGLGIRVTAGLFQRAFICLSVCPSHLSQ